MDDQGNEIDRLNPTAKQVWEWLLERYPDWRGYFGTWDEDDLKVGVPTPVGAYAERLFIFTDHGNIWIRYSRPYACYGVDSRDELLEVIDAMLNERAYFVVITKDGQWLETNLASPGVTPDLEEGETARFISWTGKHDRVLKP